MISTSPEMKLKISFSGIPLWFAFTLNGCSTIQK